MFFSFENGRRELPPENVTPGLPAAGYIGREEVPEICERFGFASSTAEAIRSVNERFRSGVEVYDDYTFTELRIMNVSAPDGQDDCVALYLKKNLVIVVDVEDRDGSTKNKFLAATSRCYPKNVGTERLLAAFLDALIAGNAESLEDLGTRISKLEADVFANRAGKDFNRVVLELKERLLRMHNYYEQLLDITEAAEENDNEIFDEDALLCVSNVSKKVTRLREDADSLANLLSHLQDAYSAHLDLQMNRSMKIFTVMTSVFFPLTIIAGWYGMNFTHMPELTWRYGYLYVILLSAAVSAALILIGKKKKWY